MTKSALTILFLTMFFIMLGFGIIIPHLAYYANELGASPLQIGGLLAIYSAMQLVFAPMWGRLSDRKGRKPFILIGLIGNAAALILFGFSNSLVWAFIARALSGAWSAAVLPTVMAYVADVTTEEERGKGMASMGVAMGLGFILGPAIGAIMHQHHTPFFLAGMLSVVTCVFALILLPESLKAADRADGRESWVSPWEIFSPRTFKNPLMPLFLVAFCSTFVFSGLEATFPLFIADRWDYGAREMGQMFVIMGSIVALLQGSVLGKLINRCGEFRLVILGLLINALGMALLPWSVAFVTVTVYLTVTGIGNQIVRPTTSSWISKETTTGQGTAIGMMDAYLSLGRVLGPPFAGKLYTAETFRVPYWILAGMLVLALVCLFFPLRRIGRQRQ